LHELEIGLGQLPVVAAGGLVPRLLGFVDARLGLPLVIGNTGLTFGHGDKSEVAGSNTTYAAERRRSK